MKILLVEDDPILAEAVERILKKQKYVVDIAENLQIGKAALLDNEYSIVLLDRLLPDGEGTELIRYAQRKNITTRFLILSALGELEQRVEGLDLGADDYLVKPFEPEELLARIRAAERRPAPETARIIEYGNLRLNCETHTFRISGEPVMLPRRQLVILDLLMNRSGRVVARGAIEQTLYSYDDDVQPNALETHISRLRKFFVEQGAGLSIVTVRGVGYMLKEAE